MKKYILRKFFDIQPDESKKAGYLIAFFSVAGFYFTFTGSISISVFDIRFGAKYLPYILFAFPLLNMAFSYVYMKIMTRVSKNKLFEYFMLFVFIIHIFNFAILYGIFTSKIFFAILLLLCLLVNEKLYFLSMMMLQDVADIESIKRLLPLSTAAFTLASIISTFFLSQAAAYIRTEILFLFSTLFIFCIAFFAKIILKKYKTVSEISEISSDEGTNQTYKYIRENSFIYILISVAVVVDVTFNINDYLYNVIASRAIPIETKFIGFIATTEAVRYILTLAVDLFLFTRVINKIGSLNAVKIVFISAIVGTSLLITGSINIYWIMSSKIIYTVLVMLLSYSLMQILYQPVHQKYKEKVMIIADIVVVFAGSALGGAVTLMHSYGLINTFFINAISMAAIVFIFLLWQMKQAGFINIIERSMNLADNLDINKLFGKTGISEFLPYMIKKVELGKPYEKILMLDILKHVEFKEKETLFKNALLSGDLELSMKIIDMAFDGSIPFSVVSDSCQQLAKNSQILQYLIYNIFTNYRLAEKSGVIESLSTFKNEVEISKLHQPQQLMFEYLYLDKKEGYQLILSHMSNSHKSSDLLIVLKIMENFIGIEDEINCSILLSIMLNIRRYKGIIKYTPLLCSFYDKNMMYLREVFTGYCQKEVIEKVCDYYKCETVINALKDSKMLIPTVYILHAATQLNQSEMNNYIDIYNLVKKSLKELIIEKLKIQQAKHEVKTILNEEIERLICSVSAVLLEFLFAYHGLPAIANMEKHLNSVDGKKMISEIIRNALPIKISNEIIPIIEEKFEINDDVLHYNTLIIGGIYQLLSNLYMLLGGEQMEEHFTKEIETVSILKRTLVFKNLDIESLYELLRIGEFVSYNSGQTVLRKGEIADKLYVLIKGKAEMFRNETKDDASFVECGEMFGEEDIIEKSRRLSTVNTLEPSIFFKINGDEFTTLVKTNNEVAFSLLEVLASKLRSDMKL